MKHDSLPSGAEFRNRFIASSLILAAGATVMMAFYLKALIRLPAEQWRGFAWLVGGLFLILFVAQDRANRRLWSPIVRCLDRLHGDGAEPEDIRRGFAAATNLPLQQQRLGIFWWALGGVLVPVAMKVWFETFTWFSAMVMLAAAMSGGFIMTCFNSLSMKRIAEPVRVALAQELPDPAERRALVRTASLKRKLLISVTGVTICTVMFAILYGHVRSVRPLEAHVARVQGRFLEQVAARMATQGAGVLEQATARARQLGIADAVGLVDAELSSVIGGELGALLSGELRSIRESGLERGDNATIDSPRLISWLRLPEDGRVLVALSEREALMGDATKTALIFLLLLTVTAGVALCLAYLLADDVGRATKALRAEAERLSSGDLRRSRVFESEDELGELSRSFEGMARSLRATVSRVAEAADRVEVTAGEMASVSESVTAVTTDQVQGIQQTTSSMEAINNQVREIADSAQGLNVSVEESSSSVLELGAAGEELNETAGGLSERVNEVSTSIEQMVRSVKQVLENAEALSEAAVETSGSMDEMATSMREVDSSAEETARLSREVVKSAESGQVKMVQTIEGMDAIREATETAERVIRGLGARASEIGAIVDVIDDVADETNLLALNAAIIAAQAGEHGRAFSVVADEIKDLADRVLTSTKEIGGLIQAVQEESSNAIGAIERGAQSVASGVDMAAEAGVSLEQITRASRESGERIAGIVAAVREQARAASQVVELMERVRSGVEEIRTAAVEQDRGNEVVYRSSLAMRDVAQQVRGTTQEQARGSGRIRDSVEGVREAVEQINSALQEQSVSCRSAVEFLEAMHARTRSNEESAQRLDQVAKDLLTQSEALRQDIQRFRIE